MTTRLINKDDVKIFKGKYYLPWFLTTVEHIEFIELKKVVVLDLDETLGSFADLYILWSGFRHVLKDTSHFTSLCDLYPEFLRYGILTILEYLYEQKLQKECDQIFIYTNNQCSGKWVSLITKYLEDKVKQNYSVKPKVPLFDKAIEAFKINNKPVETSRSSHSKKMDDFLKCSLVSENADICFIDDVHHPAMKGTKVYYINPRPYVHYLSTQTIIQRIIQAPWIPKGILSLELFWKDWFRMHQRKIIRKGKNDIDIDLQVSQKIIYHLREFMMFGKKPTSIKISLKSRFSQKRKHRAAENRKTKRTRLDRSYVKG
jgi:hypothetical protein